MGLMGTLVRGRARRAGVLDAAYEKLERPFLLDRLLDLRTKPFLVGRLARHFMRWYFCVTVECESFYGEGARIMHGYATGIHPKTTLGENVTIYQTVTLGRGELFSAEPDDFGGVVVEDHAVVCAGVIVAAPEEGIVIGEGTVIAANAVLTKSTGDWEVWGGIPARKLGERPNREVTLSRWNQIKTAGLAPTRGGRLEKRGTL